ncbi:hypothetical protein D5R81_14485 [Parashewanella spongiae]|uniref:Porin n=1 Tax=Parashewanella spongiae TaxID=342950 RepID=A0A3A6T808_9GAMM|nr:DcaP family trimeric outer membrane transporter [Parashewanella spongiae]MCL1079172.1 porin [Parashewanella spongiae]RJY10574.1 hypothetical protein D5R81_14485 [Parashewanella spongiae]
MKTLTKTLLAASILAAGSANAGYKIDIDDKSNITFGGYIKVDTRFVSGDIAYRDFWIGNGAVLPEDQSQFRIFADETRFNTKYVNGDLMGFIEMDFLGGGGNQIVSNSSKPRIRHAFIKYKDFTAGQTWTTFMNTAAIPETADFAGATVGLAFIRQGLLRYSKNGFQIALENPESWGGDSSKDSMPDVIARYDFKGDWGTISVSGLGRELVTQLGKKEMAFGGSIAGKLKVGDKDDFKFQAHFGEVGRYIGVGASPDVIGEEVEKVTSYLGAYRHFWTDTMRSNVFFGNITSDVADIDRNQWGVNVFEDITKQLTLGFEVGQFTMKGPDADSFYGQLSLRYML